MSRGLPPLLLVVAAVAMAALPASEPVMPDGTVSIHGRWRPDQRGADLRFWLRLTPPSAQHGGHRLIELVSEARSAPPPALEQPRRSDCPFLVVDAMGRLMAWDDRTTATRIDRVADGYQGSIELVRRDDQAPGERPVLMRCLAGWERSTAPLLLALAWRDQADADIPLIDPLGGGSAGLLRWRAAVVDLGGRPCRVEADAAGRLQRLVADDGAPLVSVLARTESPPP